MTVYVWELPVARSLDVVGRGAGYFCMVRRPNGRMTRPVSKSTNEEQEALFGVMVWFWWWDPGC